MVRLGSIAIALVLAACSGEIQSENLEGLSPEEQVAQEKWVDKALPVFTTKCVMCHDGSMPMIGYLAGEDDLARRETLVNHMPRVVNLTAPQSSRVLTKGAHTGPSLDATEASDILSWIIAEREARPVGEPIRTPQAVMQICTAGNPGDPTCPVNMIDLTGLGVAGRVEVVVQQLVADSYFTNIKAIAGAEGLYLEHPLFETWPMDATEPTPDSIDRWFNVSLNLAPNAEAPIGTGEGSFIGFKASDPVSLRVDVIEKQRPMM